MLPVPKESLDTISGSLTLELFHRRVSRTPHYRFFPPSVASSFASLVSVHFAPFSSLCTLDVGQSHLSRASVSRQTLRPNCWVDASTPRSHLASQLQHHPKAFTYRLQICVSTPIFFPFPFFHLAAALFLLLVVLPKLGLCSLVLSRNAETEFGAEERRALFASPGERDHSRLTPWRPCPALGEKRKGCYIWGVAKRDTVKNQGRRTFAVALSLWHRDLLSGGGMLHQVVSIFHSVGVYFILFHFIYFILYFFFLGPHPLHMGVPRIGVPLELQKWLNRNFWNGADQWGYYRFSVIAGLLTPAGFDVAEMCDCLDKKTGKNQSNLQNPLFYWRKKLESVCSVMGEPIARSLSQEPHRTFKHKRCPS